MKKLIDKFIYGFDRIENVLLIALLFSVIISALKIKGSELLLPTLFGAYALVHHFGILFMHKRIDISKEFSHSVIFWYRIFGIGYTLTLITLALTYASLDHKFIVALLVLGGFLSVLGLGFLYPRKKDMQKMGFSFARTFIKAIIVAALCLLIFKEVI